MSAINTEIMPAAGDLHDEVGDPVLCEAKHVLDNAAAFDASDGVLNHDSDAGQDLVA